MSRMRARVEIRCRERTKSERVRAPITEDERIRGFFAMTPDAGADARRRLAERITRLIEAGDGGDETAAAQPDRVRAAWIDLANRHV